MQKKFLIAWVLAAIPLFVCHKTAFADMLIDTGTPTNTSLQWSFHGNPISEVWHAGRFSLDQSYYLTDISLYLTPYYAGTVTVSIYPGDVVPVVGSELLSDTFLGTTGGPTGWYGISELNWEVSSGSYWVAFEAREKDYYYSTLPSAAPSPMDAYAIYNPSLGGWFLTPNAGTGIRISGEVVHVPGAALLDGLRAYILQQVALGNIDAEMEVSLLAKVDAALAALDRRNPNDAKVAMNDLKALVNQVEAQVGKKITAEVAAEIIQRANEIIAELGG